MRTNLMYQLRPFYLSTTSNWLSIETYQTLETATCFYFDSTTRERIKSIILLRIKVDSIVWKSLSSLSEKIGGRICGFEENVVDVFSRLIENANVKNRRAQRKSIVKS